MKRLLFVLLLLPCCGVDETRDNPLDEKGVNHCPCIDKNSTVDMGSYYIDKYEASRADATSKSVGDSNSCACSIPGVLPWEDINWYDAKNACEKKGSGWGLCSNDEWGDACDGTPGDGGYTYPYGDTYEGSTCNGDDAGNGKAVPTGSMTGCKSADGIYDMSGNVWEWIEKVSENLRGGDWGSYSTALACSSWSSSDPAYDGSSIGFRCCQDK